MKTNITGQIRVSKTDKKAYQTPRLKVVGRVSDLTLKVGSNTDGFGGAFS